MKFAYKGLLGIAALRKKRKDEKKAAGQRPTYKERRGIITRIAEEMKNNGTRREQRIQAKVFKKDPVHYSENMGMHITRRGVLL